MIYSTLRDANQSATDPSPASRAVLIAVLNSRRAVPWTEMEVAPLSLIHERAKVIVMAWSYLRGTSSPELAVLLTLRDGDHYRRFFDGAIVHLQEAAFILYRSRDGGVFIGLTPQGEILAMRFQREMEVMAAVDPQIYLRAKFIIDTATKRQRRAPDTSSAAGTGKHDVSR